MSKLDRIIAWRIFSRIALVVLVFYALIGLSESLDSWRFAVLSESKGQDIAILAIFSNAARWSIKILPVTVLIGTIIGVLDLQAHRELTIIKASGISIWRILLFPIIIIVVGSLIISIFLDAQITKINRSIMPAYQTIKPTIGKENQVWLIQQSQGERYIMQGSKSAKGVYILKDVTIFQPQNDKYSRIKANLATLSQGEWQLENATLFTSGKQKQLVKSYTISTNSNRSDLELKFTSTDDFTFFELRNAIISGLSDPLAQSAATTRYTKLLALPFLLVGSLLIAFAFSSSYRRTGSYGSAILAGVVIGFVVFILTEMADRAGAAGVLNPLIAGWGPAMVAIIIGTSVLLYKEDGRL